MLITKIMHFENKILQNVYSSILIKKQHPFAHSLYVGFKVEFPVYYVSICRSDVWFFYVLLKLCLCGFPMNVISMQVPRCISELFRLFNFHAQYSKSLSTWVSNAKKYISGTFDSSKVCPKNVHYYKFIIYKYK